MPEERLQAGQAPGASPAHAAPIRVLVLAATWWWREALLRVLEQDGGMFAPVAAASRQGVARRLAEIDVAIVDLDHEEGLLALAEARERDVPCVALGSSTTQRQVSEALSIGASFAVKAELDPNRIRHLVSMAAHGDTLLVRASSRFLRNLAPSSPRDRYNLTRRELEVLEQLARGRTNAEIATSLYLAPSSVKKLVSRCLARLGARNRVEAALVARREGLVDVGEEPSN